MRSSDEILEGAARDGGIDIAEWPRVLENLLRKLHDIVHNDFPLPAFPLLPPLPPTVDPEVVASTPPRLGLADSESHRDIDQDLPDVEVLDDELPPNSQSSTKENEAPSTASTERLRSIPAFEVNHAISSGDAGIDSDYPLPPDLLSLYNHSTRILEYEFALSPPYTIQRLAEMILYPRKHYRFLPAYLRALDRVVSVTSPITDFPLPRLHQSSSNGGFLVNGDMSHANGNNDGLGSDESLGGALLTPIPWIHTAAHPHDGELHSESSETIDGPNGTGRIETVTVTVNGIASAASAAHTFSAPGSPTLSEQSDASSSNSSSGTTEALLREQGAVTQGELLRQEQEAGIGVEMNPYARRPIAAAGAALALGRESLLSNPSYPISSSTSDPAPLDLRSASHVRGPEEIGVEDTGLQPEIPGSREIGSMDLEAAVGRRSKSPQPPPSNAEIAERFPAAATSASPTGMEEAGTEGKEVLTPGKPGIDPADVEKDVARLREAMDAETLALAREGDKGRGGDTVIADVDGRVVKEGDPEDMEVSRHETGPDAVDSTAL